MKEIVSDDRDFLYFNICFTIIKERVLYIQKYIMSIWTYLQKRKFTNGIWQCLKKYINHLSLKANVKNILFEIYLKKMML
jgi:hypothetical protein